MLLLLRAQEYLQDAFADVVADKKRVKTIEDKSPSST
jgi:hypothetical protein